MDTHQLIQCLWQDSCTRRHFGNVSPLDMLPATPVTPQQQIYIVNTDTHTGPGKHWVLIYLPLNAPGEFFDSLGQDLTTYGSHLECFMATNRTGYVFNTQRLQGDYSWTCGHYCLYYAVHRCYGVSPENIINTFTSNYSFNDDKVLRFVHDYFDYL